MVAICRYGCTCRKASERATYPKTFEIICYHCQQAAEKLVKALVLAYDGEIQKTHDLGLLTEQLSEFLELPESVLTSADLLTPYGVKIRYPHELCIEESHTEKALSDMNIVYDFVKKEIAKLK